jgi:hypothetical protein
MPRDAAAQARCSLPVPLPEAVASARLVYLGEYHGTEETPLFAAEFACVQAQVGQPVTLALEMLQAEQPALDTYLASDGGPAARRKLLAGSFWRNTTDGRASTGTLAMIERVRLMRRSGLNVALLPLDGITEGTRDATMASRLRKAMDEDTSRRFVVLAGNMHTSKARGSPVDPTYESIAYQLRDRPSVALNVVPQSGSAWLCASRRSCGPMQIGGRPGAADGAVELRMGYSAQAGYDGTVLLPRATAAEPAIRLQKR